MKNKITITLKDLSEDEVDILKLAMSFLLCNSDEANEAHDSDYSEDQIRNLEAKIYKELS